MKEWVLVCNHEELIGAADRGLSDGRRRTQAWTVGGIGAIVTIDRTGGSRQLVAAKRRHRTGDAAMVDPLPGGFLLRINEQPDRPDVADVTGDRRGELLALSGGELRINENPEPNRIAPGFGTSTSPSAARR